MVKLRLARFGRKNIPFYRLVAIQAKTKRSGVAIEFLGTYDPKLQKNKLTMKEDRVKYWLSVGAQPTDTVHHLLAKAGLVKPLKKKYKKAPGKNVQAKIDKEKSSKEEAKTKTEAPKPEEKPAEEQAETKTEAPAKPEEVAPAEEVKSE